MDIFLKNLYKTLIILVAMSKLDCARILLLTPPVNGGSKSHRHIMTSVGETLASHGHEVTMLLQGEASVILRAHSHLPTPNTDCKFQGVVKCSLSVL